MKYIATAPLLLLFLLSCGNEDSQPANRPDLVLIVVDTLRADHLSLYGYDRPTTPGLKSIANDGVLFLDTTAQSSWTLPSMASLLSGRRVFINALEMPPTVPTLAEMLQASGYETHAFVGNPAISPKGNYHRGFNTFTGREVTGDKTWDCSDLEKTLSSFLEQRPQSDKPQFYYLHYLDPHYPYAPSDTPLTTNRVTIRPDVFEAWESTAKGLAPNHPIHSSWEDDQASIAKAIDSYDKEIAAIDRSVINVLELLDSARPSGRDSLFILASDHGEGLWDHAHHPEVVSRSIEDEKQTLQHLYFRDHSYHLYQELLHTPLLVAGPGFRGGTQCSLPVENIDIFPTLLHAAGVALPDTLDGQPLQQILSGDLRPAPFITAHANEGTMIRATQSGWKLVWPTDTGFSFGMPAQLYHLGADPYERNNQVEHQVEIYAQLLKIREQMVSGFNLYEGETPSIDPEQQKVLKEMGYLDVGGR